METDASSSPFNTLLGHGRLWSSGQKGKGQWVTEASSQRSMKELNFHVFRNLTLSVLSSWDLVASQNRKDFGNLILSPTVC